MTKRERKRMKTTLQAKKASSRSVVYCKSIWQGTPMNSSMNAWVRKKKDRKTQAGKEREKGNDIFFNDNQFN